MGRRLQCRRLSDLLSDLQINRQISPEHRKRIAPASPFSGTMPVFYGLPKVHKVGVLQIRPIVSNKGLYCDDLMVHLKLILNTLFEEEHSVLNSYDLVHRLEQLNTTPRTA